VQIKKRDILIGVGVVLIGLLAYFVYCSNVYDNGNGIDAIRAGLSDIKAKQQSAIDRLGVVENGLTDSQKRVDEISNSVRTATDAVDSAESRIEQSQVRVESSANAIITCESILRQVRERGQVGN